MSLTAIVLAGGRSSRFGGDKLAAELDGRSVLAATIAAVAPLADGVIVAGPELPTSFEAGDAPVALVRDAAPFAGPLVALANVLAGVDPEATSDTAIVVGGDMPRVVAGVLGLMLARLAADPAIDAVLLGRPPRRQVLPLAIRVGPAARAARDAVDTGDRSLRSLLDRLPHLELPEREWLPLDPAGQTLTDVDTKADLDRLRAPDVR